MSRLDWEGAARRDAARPARSERRPVAWWLTLTRASGRCDECRERLPKGAVIAYNHAEKRVLCELCVDRLGVAAQPSRRLLASRAEPAEPERKPGRKPRRRRHPRRARNDWLTDEQRAIVDDAMRRQR